MGTGPYRLVSREPDRKTVVEKNPAWWDKLRATPILSNSTSSPALPTRVAALLSGEEDMVYSVPPQDMKRIAAAPDCTSSSIPSCAPSISASIWARVERQFRREGQKPVQGLRVRQAFSLAIDEDLIASKVMLGLAHPTWLMWGPGSTAISGADVRAQTRPCERRSN